MLYSIFFKVYKFLIFEKSKFALRQLNAVNQSLSEDEDDVGSMCGASIHSKCLQWWRVDTSFCQRCTIKRCVT